MKTMTQHFTVNTLNFSLVYEARFFFNERKEQLYIYNEICIPVLYKLLALSEPDIYGK